LSTLQSVELWSKILSALAIPVVLAVVGWMVQDSVSSESIKKDYVTLAIGILQDEKVRDPELKAWALSIVRKNSPVPLSAELQTKIVLGAMQAVRPVRWDPMPDVVMAAPMLPKAIPLEKVKRGDISAVQLYEGWIDADYAARMNASRLESLQKLVRIRDQLQRELEEKTLARESKRIAGDGQK
jgi:hypothetical protein